MMRRKLFGLSTIILVLIVAMTVCLVGCGNDKPSETEDTVDEAFQNVYLKDGNAVYKIISLAILNKNITINSYLADKDEKTHIVVKLDTNKAEYSKEITTIDGTNKFAGMAEVKGEMLDEYSYVDGKWYGPHTYKSNIDLYTSNIGILGLLDNFKDAQFVYNCNDDNYVGMRISNSGNDEKLIMKIINGSIEIEVHDSDTKFTITASDMYKTKITAPVVSK